MTFRFAHPVAIMLLLMPLALVLAYAWRRLKFISSPVMTYSDLRMMEGLPVGWRVRFRRIPAILRLCAWLLVVLALARPQSGQTQTIIRGQGVDIVLALDVSGSMSALDFAPQNRLDAAKTVISNFISGRDFDRIGLVIFARDAFQQIPPTLDYTTLLDSLGHVKLASSLHIDDGTAIGLGIASAGNMLRSSLTTSKIIILLTDGSNNAGRIGPLTAARAVSVFNIRVYTIGIGLPGLVPITIDEAGNTQLIESDLDEQTLDTIAQATGGRYFRAEDMADLQQIYDEIDRLEHSDVERQIYVEWQEQAAILLWCVLALLIVERVLQHTLFQSLP